MKNTLYYQTTEEIRLYDAIQDSSDFLDSAVGLLYSPQACFLIKLHRGRDSTEIETSSDVDIDLAFVFEAKIFNSLAELRWLHQDEGYGKAVLLSEENRGTIWQESESLTAIATIQQQYVLWGEGKENATDSQPKPGWSRLVANRIGYLDVPISEVPANGKVILTSREYLQEGSYGNVFVCEEKLNSYEAI